jgi:predicted phage terminase large subunit-like protein
LDDIEGEENVSTAEQRDKLHKWMLSVLVPAMDPKNTRIRFVGTILHEDSLLNKALKSEAWHPMVLKAHNKTFSQILWPSRFTKDKLQALRSEFESQGKLYLYYQEYLNTVIPDGGQFFATDKIEYVDAVPEGAEYYTACDLAISEATRADFTVIATIAAKDGVMYIADIKRGRWNSFEIVEMMIQTERQFHPTTFTIERGSIEKSIKPYLELEEQKQRVFIAKRYVSAISDKKSRARGLQGLVTSGRVRIVRRIENLSETMYEMDKFGSAQHDDIVDALSYACYDIQMKLREEQEVKIAKIINAPPSDVAMFFLSENYGQSSGDGWGD